jgi:hypothetical protein
MAAIVGSCLPAFHRTNRYEDPVATRFFEFLTRLASIDVLPFLERFYAVCDLFRLISAAL